MLEKKKEEVVSAGWYSWLHANVRNWYDKNYRKKLHEFSTDHRLCKSVGDLELTITLMTSFHPQETESYFLMECVDIGDEKDSYRMTSTEHLQTNYQYICFDNGKILIPKLAIYFKKYERKDGSSDRDMYIPDLTDKNEFLYYVFEPLDKFFPHF